MKIIQHNGQFMRAEPAEVHTVAVVWSNKQGGEITSAVDLGLHENERSVLKAVEDAGFKVRRGLSLGATAVGFDFGNGTKRFDAEIQVYE